jgi:hypothetical protein
VKQRGDEVPDPGEHAVVEGLDAEAADGHRGGHDHHQGSQHQGGVVTDTDTDQ